MAVREWLDVLALESRHAHSGVMHHAVCWRPQGSSSGCRRGLRVAVVRVVDDGARLVRASLMFDHGGLTTKAVRIVRLVVSAACDTVNVRFSTASMLARVRSFSCVDSAVASQT